MSEGDRQVLERAVVILEGIAAAPLLKGAGRVERSAWNRERYRAEIAAAKVRFLLEVAA
jgi:hypothetical protein